MAKRRRSKYKPRPVNPQPEATDDPLLQSQQVGAATTAPVAPATGAPMPIADPTGWGNPRPKEKTPGELDPESSENAGTRTLPSMTPDEFNAKYGSRQDQYSRVRGTGPASDDAEGYKPPPVGGFARGGAIRLPAPVPDPGGFAGYISPRSDPVARRRYSPRHVGYAEGGEVDPMNFVPDQPTPSPQPQQPQFDPYNLVGRQDPVLSPYAAVTPETGYAKGGPVAAVQVPAYTDPVYPAPSPANAKLYADMDAARERVAHPQPLPSHTPLWQNSSLPAPGYQGPVPQTGGVMGYPGQSEAYRQLASSMQYNPRVFAEGGAVPEDGAADPQGYLNGDNAMDPQELDGVLQQIAQLDPNQSEDVVNLTAIVQAAQSGDMDRASSILAGFRRRFDSLNAHAQGAVAHGDLNVAAQLAGKAHSQVPDGMTVAYAVTPEGTVTATVSPSGQTFQMNGQQFHDYLVGPATDFDHILENGLEKNLAIASGGQSGQQAPGTNSAPTGYAEGGEVEDDADAVLRRQQEEELARQATQLGETNIAVSKPTRSAEPADSAPYKRDMGPSASVQDLAPRDDDSKQVVRDVLDHTRSAYGFPVGGHTALEKGIGLPPHLRPAATTDEPDIYDRSGDIPARQTQDAGPMPTTGTHLQGQIDAVKRLMPRTDDPAATGGRRRTGGLAQVDDAPAAPTAPATPYAGALAGPDVVGDRQLAPRPVATSAEDKARAAAGERTAEAGAEAKARSVARSGFDRANPAATDVSGAAREQVAPARRADAAPIYYGRDSAGQRREIMRPVPGSGGTEFQQSPESGRYREGGGGAPAGTVAVYSPGEQRTYHVPRADGGAPEPYYGLKGVTNTKTGEYKEHPAYTRSLREQERYRSGDTSPPPASASEVDPRIRGPLMVAEEQSRGRQQVQAEKERFVQQQKAIAEMTPAQLFAEHGHLLRSMPQLSEEDQRSTRPILDALREQMTRRGFAPPPQPAPAPAKSSGSMFNPANWFGGGGGEKAPRMGRLPDGTMVQID